MTQPHSSRRSLVAVALVTVLFAASCSGGEDDAGGASDNESSTAGTTQDIPVFRAGDTFLNADGEEFTWEEGEIYRLQDGENYVVQAADYQGPAVREDGTAVDSSETGQPESQLSAADLPEPPERLTAGLSGPEITSLINDVRGPTDDLVAELSRIAPTPDFIGTPTATSVVEHSMEAEHTMLDGGEVQVLDAEVSFTADIDVDSVGAFYEQRIQDLDHEIFGTESGINDGRPFASMSAVVLGFDDFGDVSISFLAETTESGDTLVTFGYRWASNEFDDLVEMFAVNSLNLTETLDGFVADRALYRLNAWTTEVNARFSSWSTRPVDTASLDDELALLKTAAESEGWTTESSDSSGDIYFRTDDPGEFRIGTSFGSEDGIRVSLTRNVFIEELAFESSTPVDAVESADVPTIEDVAPGYTSEMATALGPEASVEFAASLLGPTDDVTATMNRALPIPHVDGMPDNASITAWSVTSTPSTFDGHEFVNFSIDVRTSTPALGIDERETDDRFTEIADRVQEITDDYLAGFDAIGSVIDDRQSLDSDQFAAEVIGGSVPSFGSEASYRVSIESTAYAADEMLIDIRINGRYRVIGLDSVARNVAGWSSGIDAPIPDGGQPGGASVRVSSRGVDVSRTMRYEGEELSDIAAQVDALVDVAWTVTESDDDSRTLDGPIDGATVTVNDAVGQPGVSFQADFELPDA